MDDAPDEPVPLPITSELDLHTFRPSEVGELLPAYFEQCQLQGLRRIRVIHGKGMGTLRATVHTLLARLPHVERYWSADETAGSWGATWVQLRPGAPEKKV